MTHSEPTAAAPLTARLEDWLGQRTGTVLVAVVGVSVLLRVALYLGLAGGPCLELHRWESSDMHFFHLWGERIAAGTPLPEEGLHPLHDWHHEIARRHRAAQGLGTQMPGAAETTQLWSHWYGGTRLHQEPLYPFLIGVTYKLAGADPRWVFLWQMLLGIGSNVLVFLIARRAFGGLVATVAAAAAVLAAPLLFYEVVLLRAPLMTFLGLLVVWCTARAAEADIGEWRPWLWAGLAAGLALITRSSFVLYVLVVLGMLVHRERRQLPALARSAAPFLAGVVLLLIPVLIRNLAVGAPLLGLSSVGAVTFICASGSDYPPEMGFHLSFEHLPAIMASTDGRFWPAVVETLGTHDGVGAYLAQLFRKLAVALHWFEVPNNVSFDYFRLHSWVLAGLPVTALSIVPLGLLGMGLAVRRWSRVWPLLLLVGVQLAMLLAFYVLSRFRVSLLAALLPFAGLALVELWRWCEGRHWSRAGVAGGALAVILWVTALPLSEPHQPPPPDSPATTPPPHVPRLRPADYAAVDELWFQPRIEAAVDGGDFAAAAAVAGEAVAYQRGAVSLPATGQAPASATEATFARLYAQLHQRHGTLLERAGDSQGASRARARAAELRAPARRAPRPR